MSEKTNDDKILKDWNIQMWLGQECYKRGQYAVAEQKFKKALSDLEASFISDERMSITLNNLALCYCAQGKHEKSEPLYQKALSIDEIVLSGGVRALAEDFYNIGTHYRQQGFYDRAEPLYAKALKLWQDHLGDSCEEVGRCLNSLGILLCERGDCQAAIECFKKSLGIRGGIFGSRSKEYAESMVNLAVTYCGLNRCEEADPLFEDGVRILQYTVDPIHSELIDAMEAYVRHLKKIGNIEKAETVTSEIERFKSRNKRYA
jgi:tetratricopeptide (TPR) repeat protein